MREFGARPEEIFILCSSDSHYSMDKAANVLAIDISKAEVQKEDRSLSSEKISQTLQIAEENGKKYAIAICNMMTTMFGSVDEINLYTDALSSSGMKYKIHVDGAYGGFYFPFAKPGNKLDFSNPEVSSVTLDAHKMAQAPYGTGIFLARKGLIEYANTKEASYVEGEDYTLIGSRSGANAIAAWMILVKNSSWLGRESIHPSEKD